jgi:hypothetical protein
VFVIIMLNASLMIMIGEILKLIIITIYNYYIIYNYIIIAIYHGIVNILQ